ALARQAGPGGRDTRLHPSGVLIVAIVERTQALQAGESEVRRRQGRIDQPDARARRDAARVAPPRGLLGWRGRPRGKVGVLRREREATGMLADPVAAKV